MIGKIKMDMINYNKKDTKRINHALKVHSYAKIIGEAEGIGKSEMISLEVAAVLHDIGIKECENKYNKCGGYYQQIEGPIVAKEILKDYEIDNDLLERIVYLIGHHHTFSDVVGSDYQILLEADLIVNAQEKHISEYAFRNAVDKLFITDTGKVLAALVL